MGQMRKLPLWNNCLDTMRRNGLEFGKQFTAQFFEEELSRQAGTIGFGIDISKIRDALLDEGFYLSGEGHNGKAFEVIPAAENQKIMKQMLREATKRTRQAVRLGVNTPMKALTTSERLRHEQMLERAQIRQALIANERPIQRHIQKTAPSLLKKIQDDNPE